MAAAARFRPNSRSRFTDSSRKVNPSSYRSWPRATRPAVHRASAIPYLSSSRLNRSTVVEHDGRITGYTTGIGFFGHTVGESNEDLKALIGAASEFSGPGFLLPTRNGEVLRWCLERGQRIVQPMTLMSVGLYKDPAGTFMPSVLY